MSYTITPLGHSRSEIEPLVWPGENFMSPSTNSLSLVFPFSDRKMNELSEAEC